MIESRFENDTEVFFIHDGNETTVVRNCTSLFENIDFEDPKVLGSLVPLGVICLCVTFGNMMVIAAVRMTRKLRGATNLFIVSLAWADLMLGLMVLPFSAMYEVFNIWIFGHVWCSIWLAMDVWMCTASILHLVTISLDRYIAVTHPITYPNIMTSKRAKLLILACWILSFVICFPPLVGWNEEASQLDTSAHLSTNLTAAEHGKEAKLASRTEMVMNRCLPQCQLIQEPGYVIYSAVGSFFAPMLVMIFFNWRIYRTAKKTTKAIRQGWTKVKGSDGGNVGMGIHRGGGGGGSGSGAATASNSTRASRKASNSTRPHHPNYMAATAPSSRRTSSACVASVAANSGYNINNNNNNGGGGASTGLLRRQKTVAHHAGAAESRTLPRANGGRLLVNGHAGCGSREDSTLTVPLLSVSSKTNGSRRILSASTNSLHVPEYDPNRPRSDFMLQKDGKTSVVSASKGGAASPNAFRKPSASMSSGSISKVVRSHTGCPNHVSVKTFAEMGTQTAKADKAAAAAIMNNSKKNNNSGSKRGGSSSYSSSARKFIWRSSSAGTDATPASVTTTTPASTIDSGPPPPPPQSNAATTEGRQQLQQQRSSSPVSISQGQIQRRRGVCSCFHFKRWRHGIQAKTTKLKRRHQQQQQQQQQPSSLSTENHPQLGGGIHHDSDGDQVPPSPTSDLKRSATSVTAGVVAAAVAAANAGGGGHNGAAATKFGKRNIKSQVRRFRMETKAAKTLGIIVGCFICCWFPFFTMYLITAFCEECIPTLAFSIIFWLGYCNSAINPFIYAMFSREFRNAFKKILCKFLCNRTQHEGAGALARMGLPFAPQTVAIGLADRFPPFVPAVPVSGGGGGAGEANENLSTTSSNRASVRKNSLYP